MRRLSSVGRSLIKQKWFVVLLIYAVLSVVILRDVLVSPGTIGLRHDWNIPPSPDLVGPMEWVYTWSPQSLGFEGYWVIPILDPLFYIKLGLGADIVTKAFLLVALTISGLAMYYLCRVAGLGAVPSFVAGFFYLLTPVTFNEIVAGHTFYLISYAFSPLVIAYFSKSVDGGKIKYRTLALTALLLTVACTHVVFLPMLLLLLFLLCFFLGDRRGILTRLETLVALLLMFVAVNAMWFLPLITFPGVLNQIIEQNILPPNLIDLQSPSLNDALRLGGYITEYFRLGLETSPALLGAWGFVSTALIILVFSSVVLKPREKWVWFFALIALLGVFLAKGTSPPLGEIATWFYTNVSYSQTFREVYHLMFIPALAYGVLLAFTVDGLVRLMKRRVSYLLASTSIVMIAMMAIALYSYPLFTGDLGGQIQTYSLSPAYSELSRDLAKEGDFRVLWLPIAQPMKIEGIEYPGMDPMTILPSKRSIGRNIHRGRLVQWVPGHTPRGYTQSWATSYTSFLASTLHQDRTGRAGQLAGILNTKYLILRNDFDSLLPEAVSSGRYPAFEAMWTEDNLRDALDHQEDLALKWTLNGENASIYENDRYLPHIYAADGALLVAGDLSTLISLSYAEQLVGSGQLPVIYASQLSSPEPTEIASAVLVREGDFLDLAIPFLSDSHCIDPGRYVRHDDPAEGWTRLSGWWWYDWDYSTALEDGALSWGRHVLTIPITADQSESYEVWVKVLFGERMPSMTLSIDGRVIGSIDLATATSGKGYRWINLASLPLDAGNHELSITSHYGENVIARLIVAPRNVFDEALEKVYALLAEKPVLFLMEPENFRGKETTVFDKRISEVDWSRIDVINTTFTRSVEDDTLVVTAHFDGPEIEDEFLAMWTPVAGVSLRENPYIGLTYWVDDSNVQVVEVCFTIDYTGDGEADITISGLPHELYERPAALERHEFVFNAYEIAKRVLPDKQFYNLVEIGILPHKIWFTDVSGNVADYSFYLDRVRVFGYGGGEVSDVPFGSSQGQVLRGMGTGTSSEDTISVPKDGKYSIWARASSLTNGSLNVEVGDTQLFATIGFEELTWHELGEAYLKRGTVPIRISADNGTEVDQLVVMGTDFLTGTGVVTVSYDTVNPTRYIVRVSTDRPMFIVFSENYHPAWKASTNGRALPHFMTNSFANGFYLSEIGDHTVVIEFEHQATYQAYVAISIASLAVLVALVMISSGPLLELIRRASRYLSLARSSR